MANNETLEAVDDFTRIEGIGPKINDRLHKAGFATYDQLAAASPSEIRALVPDLGGLITDEKIAGWIGHARELIQEPEPVEPPQDAAARGNHQHYATFTVKLLLDEENDVRRTHITHVQGGSEDAWASWDQSRMVEFIVQHADLHVPTIEPPQEPPTKPATLPPQESLAEPAALPPGKPKASVKVSIELERDFDAFTADEREKFIAELSEIVKFSRDQLRVLQVEPGSVNIDIRMPIVTAQFLKGLASNGAKIITDLGIKNVKLDDSQLGPAHDPIFAETVKVCAKNKQLPGAGCLFEHEIINQSFAHDGNLIIAGLIRRSGDQQKNEHMRILVDNQQPPLFESFDKPGNEEETFSVEVPLRAGNHTVVVQHADVSAQPKSPESVHVDLMVWFNEQTSLPITVPPVMPKLQITGVNIKEGNCSDQTPQSNRIIGTDQDLCIQVEWEAPDATRASLSGDWVLKAYLESIGPGQEYTLPTNDGVRIPLNSYTSEEPSGSLNVYRYRHDITVLAGTIDTGPYMLVVAVTWEKSAGTPGDLAHFFEGPMLQIYAR